MVQASAAAALPGIRRELRGLLALRAAATEAARSSGGGAEVAAAGRAGLDLMIDGRWQVESCARCPAALGFLGRLRQVGFSREPTAFVGRARATDSWPCRNHGRNRSGAMLSERP